MKLNLYNSRAITAILVVACSVLVIAGTKVSQLTRTRSLQSTSRFMVATQDATSGRWSSRYITAPDLATNIGPWITNSGGGSGGGSTGAYSFSGGFTTTQATNVFMLPAISNLAVNLAITNISTNVNQFGASTTLSIKSGSLQTNNVFYGTHVIKGSSTNVGSNPFITSKDEGGGFAGFLAYDSTTAMFLTTSQLGLVATNSASIFYLFGGDGGATSVSAEFAPTGSVFYGHVGIATNLTVGQTVTAQSLIGSGTGTPYLLLASPNGASFGLSVNTNMAVQTTNKFDFFNVAIGQTILAHSSSAGQNVWTNGSAAGGASGTNFAGVIITNLANILGNAYVGTNLTVTNSVTAASFVGSGTGVPIIKLQTMMSADNAFAISVRTNWTQSTTNFFETTNASAGQAMVVHSSSAGQVVWTNTTPSASGGNPGATIEDHFMGGGTASGSVGELSWSYSAAAASYGGSEGHPGVFLFSGNASGTVYYLYIGLGDVTSSGNLASLGWTNTTVARIGNATSLTNSTFRFGWANDLTSAGPAHMIALNCTNGATPGTWFATVASNSVLSSLTTSITATTGWITNEVRSTGASNITFVVNGTALSAIPFCPSVGMRAFFQLIPSEASSKLAEVDYWRFRPSLGY